MFTEVLVMEFVKEMMTGQTGKFRVKLELVVVNALNQKVDTKLVLGMIKFSIMVFKALKVESVWGLVTVQDDVCCICVIDGVGSAFGTIGGIDDRSGLGYSDG